MYRKPKLRVVELRAEESLDQSCKLSGGGPGFNGGECGIDMCFTAGS